MVSHIFWLGDLNFRIEKFSKEECIEMVERGDLKPLVAQVILTLGVFKFISLGST